MIFIQDVPSIVLNLPIIITLIASTRYLIGFKTWKNYPTIALALAYFFFFSLLESTFMAITLLLAFIVLIVGGATLTRYFLRKQQVNYYSRIALMYLAATVAGLLGIYIVNLTPWSSIVSDLYFGLAVFLIGTTIDDLAALQFKKDADEFVRRLITTAVLGLLSGLLLTSTWWNAVLYRHQEILIAILIIDMIISSWTALRLTEIIRFSSIIRNRK